MLITKIPNRLPKSNKRSNLIIHTFYSQSKNATSFFITFRDKAYKKHNVKKYGRKNHSKLKI